MINSQGMKYLIFSILIMSLYQCYQPKELPPLIMQTEDVVEFNLHDSRVFRFNRDSSKADFWSSWKLDTNLLDPAFDKYIHRIEVVNHDNQVFEYLYANGKGNEIRAGNAKGVSNGERVCIQFYFIGLEEELRRTWVDSQCVVVNW